MAAAGVSIPPPLRSEEACDLEGGAVRYTRGRRQSTVPDTRLATYAWLLARREPRARVLLVHGFRSHARYNFLASSPRALRVYGGDADRGFGPGAGVGGGSSFVRELGLNGFDVHAFDHVGHGDSGGLEAYFPSFEAMVDDVIAHARSLTAGNGSHETRMDGTKVEGADAAAREVVGGKPLPLYLFGHSMGGAVAVLASMREPALFDGMMLCSAATEPPGHIVGLWGSILYYAAAVVSLFAPRLEIYPMGKNTRLPEMQLLFESDPLNSMAAVRGRVAHSFLLAYQEIASGLERVVIPFIAMSGGLDTLVNPSAAKRFHSGAASKDKEFHIQDEFWHNLLVEPGKEENWRMYINWIDKRVPIN